MSKEEQRVNNATAAQLRRKLQDGTAKKDDVPLAHEYAKMMANAESIALYTSIKRQAQENEE